MWMYALRSAGALVLRGWLYGYHRLEVRGRQHLPAEGSFVMVANHQSHLDAVSLISSVPLRRLHRVFPAAAADYFFSSLGRSVVASTIVNALPFDRKVKGEESLAICRRLLATPGNVLIIFPEGTRSPSGELGRFRSGIGRLVEGTDVPVIPCHIRGAHAAFPKGAWFPRPRKLLLSIGAPRRFGDRPAGRETVVQICEELHEAVAELAEG